MASVTSILGDRGGENRAPFGTNDRTIELFFPLLLLFVYIAVRV